MDHPSGNYNHENDPNNHHNYNNHNNYHTYDRHVNPSNNHQHYNNKDEYTYTNNEDGHLKIRKDDMGSNQESRDYNYYDENSMDNIMKKDEKILKDKTLNRNNRKITPYQSNAVIKMNDGILMQINKLSQYSSKWIIKARVQSKDNIRRYTSGSKEGKVFNIELCDEYGEIKANFFGKAVDKWFDFIEVGKIYKISKGMIKVANKKFNTLNHDYEITLDENSLIEILDEENENIPKYNYNFISIDNIKNMNTGSFVDIIAVVLNYQEKMQIFVKKTGQYKDKRDVTLIDESFDTIQVTLWEKNATIIDEMNLRDNCIVCFKYLKIGEWQGKKLESHARTKIEINPDNIEKAYILKNWWIHNKKMICNSINLSSNYINIETQKTIKKLKKM
ncbi:replication factor a protein [Plasmodium falciparum RAJ116]|uniref:Replication factor a protein n=1 Tax=Plasmodium falciparum RAJ116 TaxID=580058 RepID=A0A0L0CVA8_PLAFA|nr:replication factor a protein [Plasmodium falciparum RAJ116]